MLKALRPLVQDPPEPCFSAALRRFEDELEAEDKAPPSGCVPDLSLYEAALAQRLANSAQDLSAGTGGLGWSLAAQLGAVRALATLAVAKLEEPPAEAAASREVAEVRASLAAADLVLEFPGMDMRKHGPKGRQRKRLDEIVVEDAQVPAARAVLRCAAALQEAEAALV